MQESGQGIARQQTVGIRPLWRSVLALACVLLCSDGPVLADSSGVPLPAITPAKGIQCVEPVEIIRRQHMDMLDHQRDETVHGGIRGKKHSLVGCIDCHAQTDAAGEAIPIDAEGQFCESCHRYAAVTIDCFSCHATTPEQTAKSGNGISAASTARFLSAMRSKGTSHE